MTSKSVALVVEGIGRQIPAAGASKGIAWYWGHSSLNGTVVDGYEWWGGHNSQRGLVELPGSVGSEVDPFTASSNGAAFSFSLHKDPLADEMWMSRPAARFGYVGSALTVAATEVQISIPLSLYTLSSADDGTVIWVGDEAILLGTWSSSSGTFTGCTRGYYSTIASAQAQGMNIYRRNPRRETRRVVIVEYDHEAGTATPRWQGWVDDFDADSPVITVDTVELLAPLKQAVVNRGDPRAIRRAGPASISQSGVLRAQLSMPDDQPWGRRVNKVATSHWLAIQSVGAVWALKWSSTDQNADAIDVDGTLPSGSRPRLGSVHDLENGGPRFEVFFVDRVGDSSNSTAATRRSSTRDLGSPFHQIEISMALLTSTGGPVGANGAYDVLGRHWGLGLPIALFDTAFIAAEVARTLGVVVDQMVLGWDGKPVQVWEVVKSLCVSGAFFPGRDSQGRIRFARMRMATIADSCNSTAVSPIPYTLRWKPSEGEGVDQLRGTIGKLPWNDGQPYEANVLGDTELLESPSSIRAGLFSETRSTTLDLPYLTPISDEGEAGEVVVRTAFQGQGIPMVSIRVHSGTIGTGDVVEIGDPKLETPWFVDANGQPATPDGSAKWFGQVVGIDPDLGERTAVITLLMTNYYINAFARFRAPSGQVSTHSVAGKTITFTASTFGELNSAQAFSVGDKVELWRPDGRRRSGTKASPDVREITAIGTTTITLDTFFDAEPTAGDIVRLAHLDTVDGYPVAGHSGVVVSGQAVPCDLAYVYAADAAETISPTDAAGHVYALS